MHELGTNTFALLAPQSADEIKALVAGLAKSGQRAAGCRHYRGDLGVE